MGSGSHMIAVAVNAVKPSAVGGHLGSETRGAPVRGGGAGGGCQRARTMPNTPKPLYGKRGSLHFGLDDEYDAPEPYPGYNGIMYRGTSGVFVNANLRVIRQCSYPSSRQR